MRQTFRRDADSSLTTVCHCRKVKDERIWQHKPALIGLMCCGVLPKISTFGSQSAIYREGSGLKCWLEGPKSAISEKELAIFKLRKVLFSEKHLQELPRAWCHIAHSLLCTSTSILKLKYKPRLTRTCHAKQWPTSPSELVVTIENNSISISYQLITPLNRTQRLCIKYFNNVYTCVDGVECKQVQKYAYECRF